MWRSGQVSFSKESSSKDSRQEPSGRSMQALAASYNDGYSEEEEEDEEEQEEQTESAVPTEETGRMNSKMPVAGPSGMSGSWLDSPSQNMQKYGIGAKLMFQMGYKEGQGLGIKSTGIVNPIETKLRPQGLGVGGIDEKVKQAENDRMDLDSSDEEVPAKQKAQAKSRVSLFDVILELEQKDVQVPIIYKQLSDNIQESDPKTVLDAFSKLNLINSKLDELHRQETFAKYQLEEVLESIKIEKTELSNAKETLELLKTTDPTGESIEKLRNLKGYPEIGSIFASLISIECEALFDQLYAKDINSLINKLCNWSSIYKELDIASERNLIGHFDSLIYSHFQKHFRKMLYSEKLDENHNEEVLSTLQAWIDSPLFVSQDLICFKIAQELIIPYFQNELGESPDQADPTFLIDYILLLSPMEIGVFKDLLESVYERYLHYFSYENLDSFWHSKSARGLIELRRMSSIWFKVFSQYLSQNENDRFILSLKVSLIEFLSTLSLREQSDLSFALDVLDMSLFTQEETNIICQFQILNPWMKYMQETDPAEIRSLVSIWHKFWKGRAISAKENVVPLLDWYFNSLILFLNGSQDIRLPTLFGKSYPTASTVKRVLTQGIVNVNGIPANQLLSTFKDVVIDYCNLHEILFRSVPGKFHPSKGYPIYKLEFSSGKKLWCYISDDVLWVSNDVDGEYVGVHLEEVLGM